jgi:hypothetical protein
MTDALVPFERIESKIYLIRGQKVMLDMDLAGLYLVDTGYLNRQVKHNIERFPEDFMFRITKDEYEDLKCKKCISSWGGRRSLPLAFTEPGVAMLSSVLRSVRAVTVNIAIMRAFIKLRQLNADKFELNNKLSLLEKRVLKHDSDIMGLVRDIRRLSLPKPEKKIGFNVRD